MSDGYAPLFINKRQRLSVGTLYYAEDVPTKGYAHRPGWHCCSTPHAPHLKEEGRVWCKVNIDNFSIMQRPVSQGGIWYLANELTILEELA